MDEIAKNVNFSKGAIVGYPWPQFYIQLLYRPRFGICFLPFGLLGSKKKISETIKFLLNIESGSEANITTSFEIEFSMFCGLSGTTTYP